MAIFSKGMSEEMIVFSQVKKFRRGQIQAVVDPDTGKGTGQAVCVGDFSRDKRYIHTDQNGKTWKYGKFYFKFKRIQT